MGIRPFVHHNGKLHLDCLKPNMGRCVETLARATPVIDMELGKRQSRNLEKARPAYAVDPVIDPLPIASVIFIGLQNPLDDSRGLRPARRIVWDA